MYGEKGHFRADYPYSVFTAKMSAAAPDPTLDLGPRNRDLPSGIWFIPMPHYCKICKRCLPNERFSGGGHAVHICRSCKRLPAERRQAILAEQEIRDFLFRQSHISPRNLKQLQLHATSNDPHIQRLAEAVLAVALAVPYKRKRFRRLRHDHPEVLQKLVDIGLLPEWSEPGDDPEDEAADCFFPGLPDTEAVPATLDLWDDDGYPVEDRETGNT